MPSSRLMPRDSCFAMAASLHRVRLTARCSIRERRHRETTLFDAEQQRELRNIDAEPARRRELRNQTAVGDRRCIADAEPARDIARGSLERGEAVGDEVL